MAAMGPRNLKKQRTRSGEFSARILGDPSEETKDPSRCLPGPFHEVITCTLSEEDQNPGHGGDAPRILASKTPTLSLTPPDLSYLPALHLRRKRPPCKCASCTCLSSHSLTRSCTLEVSISLDRIAKEIKS